MVESTCILHTSSHPDKYNNSVNRIISKEEERRYPRRDTSIFEYSVCFHILQRTTRNPASFQPSCAKTTILHTELILLQEISKKYYNYKAHPMHTDRRHPPASVPCVSKHSTQQNKTPSSPTSIPGPYSTSRLPAILPGRNSILSGSQHPRSPYSSSQASFTRIHLVLQDSTWYYRILPGEIGFTSKGLSIVCPCNTKVSVFQITY